MTVIKDKCFSPRDGPRDFGGPPDRDMGRDRGSRWDSNGGGGGDRGPPRDDFRSGYVYLSIYFQNPEFSLPKNVSKKKKSRSMRSLILVSVVSCV